MQNDSVKSKIILSAVFFVLALGIFIFLYMETMNNHKISESNLDIWKKEYFRQNEIISLNRSIEEVEEKKNLLEEHFAKSSDVVPFLDFLEKMAKDIGLKAGVSLVDLPKEEDKLVVEMKVVGDFKTLYKFLKLLENSQYEVELTSVSLQNQEKTEVVSGGGGKASQQTEWEALLRIKLLSFIR